MCRWGARRTAEGLHGAAVSPLDAVGIHGSRRQAGLAGAQDKGERLARNARRWTGDASRWLHGHHADPGFRSSDAGISHIGCGDRAGAGSFQRCRKGVGAGIGARESIVSG